MSQYAKIRRGGVSKACGHRNIFAEIATERKKLMSMTIEHSCSKKSEVFISTMEQLIRSLCVRNPMAKKHEGVQGSRGVEVMGPYGAPLPMSSKTKLLF